MRYSNIHFQWCEAPIARFRTGVSLHSHTSHSRETFGFIHKMAGRYIPKCWLFSETDAQARITPGLHFDLKRVWWTPPCPPHDAWLLEKNQIEQRLRLRALVSLTDHDNIEAPLSLRVLDGCRHIPISVEWSVFYGPALFHLGIHNLPAKTAPQILTMLAEHTAKPRESDLQMILEALSANPQILVVFNHPVWDEAAIGVEQHTALLIDFLRTHGACIHALEVNGWRPWKENRQVLQIARVVEKPVISGGDRHAFEPNATLDLTNAATFSEYVEQVRSGWTDILITRQYREPFGLRTLQCLGEMLQDYPGHGSIASRWTDRVFYQCDDGAIRSLAELFAAGLPAGLKLLATAVNLACHHNLRRTARILGSTKREFAL